MASFREAYEREVAHGLGRDASKTAQVTDDDIAHLPGAVARYLRFAGAVGKPRVWNYRLRFRGQLRNGPESRWMRIVADQHSFVDPPARFFHIKGSMFGVPFEAFHRYVGPSATFRVKVASLFTVVDAKGPEMNQGETVTILNDMCLLAPATLIDPGLRWEELEDGRVRVIFTNAGVTVSAILTFDGSGALADFISEDRYSTTDGKTYEQLPWSTPVDEWRTFDGRQLPARTDTVWHGRDGEFAYGRFEVLDVEYNVPAA